VVARDSDDGFTLVELMVVVLVVAILLAIAIPTYQGASERAQDRRAQLTVRNALAAQLAVWADDEQFSADPATLTAAEGAIEYLVAPADDVADLPIAPPTVFVHVASTPRPNDTIVLAARSGSGRCYWIRKVGFENVERFAVEPSCTGVGLVFKSTW
jgi:type IV pilus assembly protein PilA